MSLKSTDRHGKYNCPNCAAPIGYEDKCPYCGTRFDWVPLPRLPEPDEIYLVPRSLQLDRVKHTIQVVEELDKKLMETEPLLYDCVPQYIATRLAQGFLPSVLKRMEIVRVDAKYNPMELATKYTARLDLAYRERKDY